MSIFGTKKRKKAGKKVSKKKVSKKKEDLKKVKAEKKKPKKGAKKEKVEKQEKLLPEIAALKDDELLSALAETKRGLFGNPVDKLRKDIVKRLKISDKEAITRGALLAYSRLKDVEDKLPKVLAGRKKRAEKEAKEAAERAEKGAKEAAKKEAKGQKKAKKEEAPEEVRKEIVVAKPMLKAPAEPGARATYRAERIEQLLEEQRKLEEKSKKTEKKPNIVSRAFGAVGHEINAFFGAIGHAIFIFFTTIAAIPIDLGRLIARGLGGFLQAIYRRVGGFSPLGWKKKINQLVIYSGIDKTQEEVTGITIVNGFALAGIVAAVTYFFMGWELIGVIAISGMMFGLVWVVVYSVINLMADKRSDEVEGALPDVLQIVSANISAGMTPYNALWVSARKEFGALAEEIKIAQKETLGGKPFTDALTDIGSRVRSHVLQRTIRLLIQGMKAGGELPHILQGIGADIRQMRLLQKEMAANTMSYLLFILFGMLLGAPLLFSVSIQFVDVINKFQPEALEAEELSTIEASPMMSGMSGFSMVSLSGGGCPKDFDGDGIPDAIEKEFRLDPKNTSDARLINPDTGRTYLEDYQRVAEPLPGNCITPGYLSIFSMLALFSISFFGSLLMGLIRNGKQSAGVKLMPVLIPATLGMFWLMNAGMSYFFGSLFGLK